MPSKNSILYVPLDERPCNAGLPLEFPPSSGIHILTPPPRLLGKKKVPAPYAELREWVETYLPLCRRAVLSLDMLLYGGLLPSRLHRMDSPELDERLKKLESLLKRTDCQVSAFSLIMRTPKYNSADEEPDYWEDWGELIYRRSCLLERYGPESGAVSPELQCLEHRIPREYIHDYELRRRRNLETNQKVIRLHRHGLIRHLVIVRDDSSPGGYTAMDRKKLLGNNPDILSYPGADEVGAVMLCRAALSLGDDDSRMKRRVHVLYDREDNSRRIPNYQGVSLHESVLLQVKSSGGILCDDPHHAHLILAVQTMDRRSRESWEQSDPAGPPDPESDNTFAEKIAFHLGRGKTMALADVKFSNGGDIDLVLRLGKAGIFENLAAYAAWNTAGNSIGTALAGGLAEVNWPDNEIRLSSLRYHYWDDLIYQSRVRRILLDEELPKRGVSRFDLAGEREEIAAAARRRMEEESSAIQERIGVPFLPNLRIPRISFPWNRLFEIQLED